MPGNVNRYADRSRSRLAKQDSSLESGRTARAKKSKLEEVDFAGDVEKPEELPQADPQVVGEPDQPKKENPEN